MAERFAIIDDWRVSDVPAQVQDGRVRLSPEDARLALGRDGGPDPVDLPALATQLDRPLALDLDERAAFLGISATERARALASLDAPDFTLTDLAGRRHSLGEHRGKKVLLVAYASW